MVARKCGGPWGGSGRGIIPALVATCVLGGLLACVSAQAPEPSAKAGPDRLADVKVTRDGDHTEIALMGLSQPVYTSFLRDDPKALVIDLVGVEVADAGSRVAVYDGLVDQVSMSSFSDGSSEPLARVEVSLAEDAEYEAQMGPEGLVLVLWPSAMQPALTTTEGPADLDPWADPTTPELDAEEAPYDETLTPMPAAPPAVSAPPATELTGVSTQTTAEGVLIHLRANGSVQSTESFTLDSPERLVIDLPGLGSEVNQTKHSVDSNYASRVRVGAHPGKVRIVIDGGNESQGFQGRRIVPTDDGLLVTVGQGKDLEMALQGATQTQRARSGATDLPMDPPDGFAEVELANQNEPQPAYGLSIEPETAPATGDEKHAKADPKASGTSPHDAVTHPASPDPWAEPSEKAGADATNIDFAANATPATTQKDVASKTEHVGPPIQIYGVQYDSNDDRDRVAILSDRPVRYQVLSPHPDTVVVSLQHATIAEEASGRIAPPAGGPVSLISSFQQPDVETPEVRVVVKRAADHPAEADQRGTMLFVDFARTGAMATTPPALEGEAAQAPLFEKAVTGDPSQPSREKLSQTGGPNAPNELGGPGFTMGDAPLPELPVGDYGAFEDAAAQMDDAWDAPALQGPASPNPAPRGSASANAAPGSMGAPAAVELLEEGGLIEGKEYKGRRISLDFKDVAIADVLRLIAEVSDLNLIAGDEVEGNVTIRLVDVPWDQALDVILLTKGLGFVRVGNVLRIAPGDILKAEEEVRLQERRNKEKLEDLIVKLLPVNFASVQEMSDLVKRLLTARGTVNVDQRTSTLIIKDIASVVDEATALVQAVDTETPQVMIEAKIVEANLDFSRELGTVWSFGTQPFVDGFDPASGPRTDLGGQGFTAHDANNIIFANPITAAPTALGNLNAFLLDEKFNLSVQIQAAESAGEGKVISSPRVVTLDNKEAEIEQGVSIPFQTFENGDAKLEFIDAVLSLLVTPHITANKSVIMDIEVTRNAPDDTVPTPTGSPAIAKAEARTQTLVKDGQTLVIGGIYTVNKTERESRVPYLHAVPVLGAIFKSREVTDQRKELLMFVTPRIVVRPSLAGG